VPPRARRDLSWWPLLVFALWLLAAVEARAQGADPRVPWLSAESAHFRIHYRASQRAQAEAVARAAERVYPRVTRALQWQPSRRTEIVVYSEFDLANGFSTPLPYNKIGIFLTPPDEGELLDNGAWLDLLLVHEFTHTVHMDKVRGAPRVLQQIFGRLIWFVPNLFQPGWMLEGLAVFNESEPAAGRGRLQGPLFEAWLRAERKAGFLGLAEINADGRALPLAKQYLYGAYFFEFMHRRYGADKAQALVEQYSGNIVPRLHSAPWGATGKTMDVLWEEFLADLRQRVDERAAPIERVPEALGARVLPRIFEIAALAAAPGGGLYAVVDDGLHAPRLEHIGRNGARRAVTQLNPGARLDVAADGRVLVMQPDLCDAWQLSYDVYRLEGSRLKRLTHCAHLRRAVQTRQGIVAIQLEAGRTQLVRLADGGSAAGLLHVPGEDSELVDIAAAPEGSALFAIVRNGGDWRVLEFDLGAPEAAPRERLRHDAPLSNLRHGRGGPEMLASVNGQQDVWRLVGAQWQRLTYSHTAVVAHSGTAANGSLATVAITAQGHELRWLDAAAPLASRAALPASSRPDSPAGSRPDLQPAARPDARAAPGAAAGVAAASAAAASAAMPSAGAGSAEPALGAPSPYSAWRTLYPRSWFPSIVIDRGLSAYGASTSGEDATGWHRYLAYAQWETSQQELLGGFEYIFRDRHGFALDRSLTARAWTGSEGDERTTVYDRNLQAQWLSLFPVPGLHRLAQRVHVGIGAALDRVERVQVAGGARSRLRDERLLAGVVDYDSRGSNWYADGVNRGLKLTLLHESHEPFSSSASDAAPDLDGHITRGDAKAYLGVGPGVLALRWTEARASGRTEDFQLGGATEGGSAIGFRLNNRELALRGYRGDEAELQGRHARLVSVEWRVPLAEIDRHAMVPPVGINRLAGTAFFDIGGTWDSGSRPAQYRRGFGLELRGQTRLLYALALDLRVGIARALDPVPGRGRTRGYLTLGQAF
jgi:hypothetical protein